jgi:hypothetical protein
MRYTRTRLVGAVVAAVALGVPSAAVAGQADVVHFQGTITHVEQEEDGACLDVPFPVVHTFSFNNKVRELTRRDGTLYFAVQGQLSETVTNGDTGASLSGTGTIHETDQSVVDNGDGTLTITFLSNRSQVYQVSGKGAVSVTATHQVVTLVFDLATDEVISEEVSDPVGNTGGLDFCEMAATYLS